MTCLFALSQQIPDNSSKTVEIGKIRAEVFCCIVGLSRYWLTLVKCTSWNVWDIHEKNIVHINFKPRDKIVEINSNRPIITINVNGTNSLVKSKVIDFKKKT